VALSIKSDEADRLAREIAHRTGETLTDVVVNALRQRLIREQGQRAVRPLADDLLEIGRRCRALPVLDPRAADEILAYDANGLPR
jgi:antitoxin VapB